ncbi:MAG TPA: hypothetical protein VKU01_10870 [Bryobacteraceae bacterium]|nr:hypothetical protein [Bryobacteraceae bacterium]
MIPLWAIVRFSNRVGSRFVFRIPLVLVWLLFAPIMLLVFPVFLLVCAIGHVNVRQTLRVFLGILTSLRGTHVEVGNASISLA